VVSLSNFTGRLLDKGYRIIGPISRLNFVNNTIGHYSANVGECWLHNYFIFLDRISDSIEQVVTL
jgi:hypothetical protein